MPWSRDKTASELGSLEISGSKAILTVLGEERLGNLEMGLKFGISMPLCQSLSEM